MQENGDFFAIFSLEDAQRRYSLEFKGEGRANGKSQVGVLRTRKMGVGVTSDTALAF